LSGTRKRRHTRSKNYNQSKNSFSWRYLYSILWPTLLMGHDQERKNKIFNLTRV
jgi:hypothetical protein